MDPVLISGILISGTVIVGLVVVYKIAEFYMMYSLKKTVVNKMTNLNFTDENITEFMKKWEW